jgi:hypothetical protein
VSVTDSDFPNRVFQSMAELTQARTMLRETELAKERALREARGEYDETDHDNALLPPMGPPAKQYPSAPEKPGAPRSCRSATPELATSAMQTMGTRASSKAGPGSSSVSKGCAPARPRNSASAWRTTCTWWPGTSGAAGLRIRAGKSSSPCDMGIICTSSEVPPWPRPILQPILPRAQAAAVLGVALTPPPGPLDSQPPQAWRGRPN